MRCFFNPLADMSDEKGVQVKMEGIQEVLTKEVEEMTVENEEEFGNDPILIYQGDMWLNIHHHHHMIATLALVPVLTYLKAT